MTEDPNSPEAQGWRLCAESKPGAWVSVYLALADSSVRVGFWNGSTWIAAGVEVEAVYWRHLGSE